MRLPLCRFVCRLGCSASWTTRKSDDWAKLKSRPIDVRIVAATNQPLTEMIRRSEFREDLYHRLNVYQIPSPASERAIFPTFRFWWHHFLEDLNRREGHEREIDGEAISHLSRYSFAGNVRELENIIESAYHLAEGNTISVGDISLRLDRRLVGGSPALPHAESIVEDLVTGRVDFWRAVRDPFLKRDLSP